MKWRDPDEARRRLFEVAQTQAGYFSAAQALEAGYSRRLQHYHAERGHWLRVERGIYRLREYPTGQHEDLVRWILWSRGQAVVSHDTAAAVHELGDLLPARIHLTLPKGFRKLVPPAVVVHRGDLPAGDVQAMGGLRVTTPLRTILDLVRGDTESDHLVGVVRDALARGAVRRRSIEREIEKLDGASRARGARILSLAQEAERAV